MFTATAVVLLLLMLMFWWSRRGCTRNLLILPKMGVNRRSRQHRAHAMYHSDREYSHRFTLTSIV